jgi:mannan endo-1,4-beta-mannosidase
VRRRATIGLLLSAVAAVSIAGCTIPRVPAPPAGPGGVAPIGAGQQSQRPTLPPYNIARLVDPASGKYLGVEGTGAPGSLAPTSSFAASIGRKPNIIGQYLAWKSAFAPQAVIRNWSYGALTYLAWEPYGTTSRAIAEGHSDAYISQFAQAVRALSLPVAISFGHEMNGFWYPWGTTQTPAADFVAAWRHIHDLFARAGATNVIWVWNPNVIFPVPQVQLRPYYPGNAYVTWIGLTGYFAETGPQTYAALYQPTIAEIHGFTHKPFLIAETSVETGPTEVSCVNHLIGAVTRHPDILGFIWFDYNKAGVDWRVESRPVLRAALARDLAGVPLISVN